MGPGRSGGAAPQGSEVVMKKAAVPAFRASLLERRVTAAAEIGLALCPAEAARPAAGPAARLEATIAVTIMPFRYHAIFPGTEGAAMLAALDAVKAAERDCCRGIR